MATESRRPAGISRCEVGRAPELCGSASYSYASAAIKC